MSMGAFGFIILAGRDGHEADSLDDYKGLAESSPWFALVMLLFMFSLAGVPPLLGFWAKWYVIKEVIAIGHVWLALLAVVFSVTGAYYYLRVVKIMYFDKADPAPVLGRQPPGENPGKPERPGSAAAGIRPGRAHRDLYPGAGIITPRPPCPRGTLPGC